MSATLFLPRQIDAYAQTLLQAPGSPAIDFAAPRGEPGLVPADSVSWRVFKNPVALFIGGVAAVILELAEPRVRSGVWDHSSFRSDPVRRLQRTGLAAMVTVYAARGIAEKMIAQVVRKHGRISGMTPGGQTYDVNDPALLAWVQATASFGFSEAYHAYVRPLGDAALDRFYAEGAAAAQLYGATDAPTSRATRDALFDSMRGALEPSPIIFEFLDIMRTAPALPGLLRPAQRLFVRAAVDITPTWVRDRLGLTQHGLRSGEDAAVRVAGAVADRLAMRSSPAVQACLRLGLPADHLYRR